MNQNKKNQMRMRLIIFLLLITKVWTFVLEQCSFQTKRFKSVHYPIHFNVFSGRLKTTKANSTAREARFSKSGIVLLAESCGVSANRGTADGGFNSSSAAPDNKNSDNLNGLACVLASHCEKSE